MSLRAASVTLATQKQRADRSRSTGPLEAAALLHPVSHMTSCSCSSASNLQKQVLDAGCGPALTWAGGRRLSCPPGLNHPAPLKRRVADPGVWPRRTQKDRLLHVGSQTSHGEDVQQTHGLIQRHTDGDKVSVEPQRVTCRDMTTQSQQQQKPQESFWSGVELLTHLDTPGSLLQTFLLRSGRSPAPVGL